MLELSLHLLDIARNAVEAGAGRIAVTIEEDAAADLLAMEVADDGRGMAPELARRALDPFVTTRATRHVGLGLPLLEQAARQCGGGVTVESAPGGGTTVRATFQRSHWDRAPLGDVPGALLAILLAGRPIELAYAHRVDGREFRFDTAEVRRAADGVPLTHPKILRWILEALRAGEEELKHG